METLQAIVGIFLLVALAYFLLQSAGGDWGGNDGGD